MVTPARWAFLLLAVFSLFFVVGSADVSGQGSIGSHKGANADRDSFYNADRDPPYLSNHVSGHKTRSVAIAALASQFGKSTRWVEANMGSSNTLAQIHANLAMAMLREAGDQP
jgi:hypothetical protein